MDELTYDKESVGYTKIEYFLGEDMAQRFEYLDLCGLGGMGRVYKVKDRKTGEISALKFLTDSSKKSSVSRRKRSRFFREAVALETLRGDEIIGIKEYDFWGTALRDYILMEHFPGRPLDETIFDFGPKELKSQRHILRGLRYFSRIFDGIEKVHKMGLIHRDLKPSNILVGGGTVKIIDFGLCKTIDPSLSESFCAKKIDLAASLREIHEEILLPKTTLTVEGSFVGTPAYSSPEQIRGDELDQRTDIYSAGISLYEFLTGERAFHGYGTAFQVNMFDPITPRNINSQISRSLSSLVMDCIDKKPNNRPRDVSDLRAHFRDELRAYSERAKSETELVA